MTMDFAFNALAQPAPERPQAETPKYPFLVVNAHTVVETDADPKPQNGRRTRTYTFGITENQGVSEAILNNDGTFFYVGNFKLQEIDRKQLQIAHTALLNLGGMPGPLDDCLDEKKCQQARLAMRRAESYALGPSRRYSRL
jgi:hypothetical protein